MKKIICGITASLIFALANIGFAQNIVVGTRNMHTCALCGGGVAKGFTSVTTYGQNPKEFPVCFRGACAASTNKIWYVDLYNRLIDMDGNIMKTTASAQVAPVVAGVGQNASTPTPAAAVALKDTLSLVYSSGKKGVYSYWKGMIPNGEHVANVFMPYGKAEIAFKPGATKYGRAFIVPVTYENRNGLPIGSMIVRGRQVADTSDAWASHINSWLCVKAGKLNITDGINPKCSDEIGLVKVGSSSSGVDLTKISDIGHDRHGSQLFWSYLVKYQLRGVTSYRYIQIIKSFTAAEAVALVLSMGRPNLRSTVEVYCAQGGHKYVAYKGARFDFYGNEYASGALCLYRSAPQ